MITKRDCISRGSCYYEKCITVLNFGLTKTANDRDLTVFHVSWGY